MHRNDVGMVQLRRDLDFAQEAVTAQRGRELGPQHLDRHLAAVLQVLRPEHSGHPALASHPLDPVLFGQHPPDSPNLDRARGGEAGIMAGLGGRCYQAPMTELLVIGEGRLARGTVPGGSLHVVEALTCSGNRPIYPRIRMSGGDPGLRISG